MPGLLPGRPLGRRPQGPRPRSRWPGDKATLPTLPAGTGTASLARPRKTASSARCSSRRRPGRPARPGRRAARARPDAVHRLAGAAGQRGHRPRRRGLPGRRGRREGRHVRQLGGPGAHVRRGAQPAQMQGGQAHRPVRARPIADEMDVHLGLPDAAAARRELAALGTWDGRRGPAAAAETTRNSPAPGAGQAVLATGTWHAAARRRPAAGRRAVPGRHRPAVVRGCPPPPRPRSASPTATR
jgi:hypothetical protein